MSTSLGNEFNKPSMRMRGMSTNCLDTSAVPPFVRIDAAKTTILRLGFPPTEKPKPVSDSDRDPQKSQSTSSPKYKQPRGCTVPSSAEVFCSDGLQ
jgi:hypothetical protein